MKWMKSSLRNIEYRTPNTLWNIEHRTPNIEYRRRSENEGKTKGIGGKSLAGESEHAEFA